MEEDVEEAEDTDSVDTEAATAAQTGALHEAAADTVAVADTVLGRHTARTAGVTLAGVATAHRAVAATWGEASIGEPEGDIPAAAGDRGTTRNADVSFEPFVKSVGDPTARLRLL